MCISIIGALIGAVTSIAGSFMQAQAANQQAEMQYAVEAQQRKVEMENQYITSLSETNNKMEQYRRATARNEALIAASGITQNISYDIAIAPAEQRVYELEVARQQYNSNAEIGANKYGIAVAAANRDAQINANNTTAVANSIGAIGSIFA